MIDRCARVPRLVLDTNVVLDWLYFADPRCAALAQAVAAGQVRWLATTAMCDELRHVLERGVRPARPGDSAAVWTGWQRWASGVDPGGGAMPAGLRCTDPDDQKFIDLAWQVGACALLSRDRAVLKVARRAAALGLRICDVDGWQRADVEPAAVSLGSLGRGGRVWVGASALRDNPHPSLPPAGEGADRGGDPRGWFPV